MTARFKREALLDTPPTTASTRASLSAVSDSVQKPYSPITFPSHDALVSSLDIATPSKTVRRTPIELATRNMRQASGPFEGQLARLQALGLRQMSHAGDQSQESEADEEAAQLDRFEEALVLLHDLQVEDDMAWALQGRQAAAYIDDLFEKLHETMASRPDGYTTLRAKLQDAAPALDNMRTQLHATEDYEDCRGSLEAIEQEMKALRTSIFQVEEQRHVAMPPEPIAPDILAGILQEEPEGEDTGTPGKVFGEDLLSRWDRQLTDTMLQLASRLQPLRASISLFRPRIEIFELRASGRFPSAVTALRDTYTSLEGQCSILFREFSTLKQELGEDKWMAVFRQVNKQASDMMESLERTLKRLEALPCKGAEAEKLATAFEMKAEHYGKSIPAVLNIMAAGVKNRATLNGEIIRGYDLLMQRWQKLAAAMEAMQHKLEGARTGGSMRRTLGPASGNHQSPERKTSGPFSKSAARIAQPRLLYPGTPRRVQPTPSQTASPSPALFRRDISLDPPRSRSRLSMHGAANHNLLQSPPKPVWNAGTAVARDPDFKDPLTPMRSVSRLASHPSSLRSGAQSSLGFSRATGASTPSGDRRVSGIPRVSTRRVTGGVRSPVPPVPPMPTHLSAATIERLSKPKGPQLGVLPPPPAPLQPAFQTPVKQRTGLLRPVTPSGIPSLRKAGATSVAKVRTGAGRSSEVGRMALSRPPSSMGLSSKIPLPSPRKK